MVKSYNKLVRDKIPEIIKEQGKSCSIKRISDDEEFYNKLLNKIIEEVDELRESPNEEEISDIYEVLDSIIELKNFEPMHIDYLKMKKKESRGSFKHRIYLENVEE